MKTFNFALILSLALLLLIPQTSHAQLRGLRDRLKKKAEQKIEREVEERTTRRLENELNKAIDNTVENIADDIESSIEGMVMSDEPPPPIELGKNSTGAADAPYVTFTVATRIQIGGNDMASRLLQRYGAQEEVISTFGNKQRTDENLESSQIIDADTKRIIELNHQRKEWWAMSLDDMFKSLDQMRTEAIESNPDAEDISSKIKDVKVSVDRTGKTETIHGVSAQQIVMMVEGSYEATFNEESSDESLTMNGTTYIIVDAWQSNEVAGYKTLATFGQEMAKAMGSSIQGTGFASMLSALQSTPELKKAAEDASNHLNPEEGLPVRTRTFYVQVPEGGVLDKEAVLSGASPDTPTELSQRVLMTVLTEIGNLSTEPFNEAILEPTAGYTEVESPLEQYTTGG